MIREGVIFTEELPQPIWQNYGEIPVEHLKSLRGASLKQFVHILVWAIQPISVASGPRWVGWNLGVELRLKCSDII